MDPGDPGLLVDRPGKVDQPLQVVLFHVRKQTTENAPVDCPAGLGIVAERREVAEITFVIVQRRRVA